MARRKRYKNIEPPKEGEEDAFELEPALREDPLIYTPVFVDNDDRRHELWTALKGADEFTCDTETTGLVLSVDKVIGVCISVPPWTHGYYVPMFNSPAGSYWYQKESTFREVEDLLRVNLEDERPKTFHNMLYDIPIIYFNFNTKVQNPKDDSMLLSHVIDPAQEHGLKENAVKRFHPEADYYETEMARYNYAVGGTPRKPRYWLIPPRRVALYGGADAVYTGRLKDELQSVLIPQLRTIYEQITMPLAREILDLRVHGIPLDREYLERGEKWYEARLADLLQEMRDMIGDQTFEPGSPDQLREVLYNKLQLPGGRKTKKGFSTDEDELKRLKGAHPLVDKMDEFREVDKLRGTYFTGVINDIEPDGKFRPDVLIHGTETGRLSARRIHQIPHGPLVRQSFGAGEGYILVGGDHSQLEARVLAHFSQDRALLDIYLQDLDIHCATAKLMFDLPCEVMEVKKLFPDMRRKAKTINFALLYLETIAGLARQLECSWQEAEDYYNRFFAIYEDILPWASRRVSEVRKTGVCNMLMGRRRYLPELRTMRSPGPIKYPPKKPSCFVLPNYKGGPALSLKYDHAIDIDKWTGAMAEEVRPLLSVAGKKRCAECPVLWACYYALERKRIVKEVEALERQALNSTIQGSAADLTSLGIVRTSNMIAEAGYDAQFFNYVHDEVIYRVPTDSNVDLFKEDFRRQMESVSEFLTVPLKFEPVVGPSWAELKGE